METKKIEVKKEILRVAYFTGGFVLGIIAGIAIIKMEEC